MAYFSTAHNTLSAVQKRQLQDLALICAFKATSDLPQWLSEEEKNELHAFLHAKPDIERTGRYTFRLNGRGVDFRSAMLLPDPPAGLDLLKRLALGWIGDRPWALKLFREQEKRALQNKLKELN